MVNGGLIFMVKRSLKIMVKAALTFPLTDPGISAAYMPATYVTLRETIILPDTQLRWGQTVAKITPDIRKLVDDMFETMYDAPGIGLAAIQVA